MRITVAVAALALSIISLSATAQALAAMNRAPTDIPAQELAPALRALAKDRDFQIVFATKDVSSRYTHGAVGELTADEALSQILSGTGLTYHYLDDNTVTILPINPKTPRQERTESTSSPEPPQTDNTKGVRKDTSNSFRLAQEAQGASTSPSTVEKDKDSELASQMKPIQLEEIIVTGTHIAGGAPVGAPLIVITDADIASSGYSTIGDVMKSLPEVSGGGINSSVVGARGSNNGVNVSSATSVNLRGLGSDSTLTLIDGHRVAFNGFASSSDISVIPLAGIERVEILTDSASSIYGSDAVAGVVNFILKKNYEGAQTTLRYGLSDGGGATERQANQLFGFGWTGGHFMLSYEHYDQDHLLTSSRSFSSLAASPQTLLPALKRNSVFVDARQSLSSAVSTYVEGLYSDRTSDSITNYGRPFSVHDGSKFYNVSSGIEFKLPVLWTASIDGTLSNGTDTLDYEPGDEPALYGNRTALVEARAGGKVADLPSGPIQAALGAGYRSEAYHDIDGTAAYRHVTYEFGELRIPMVLADSNRIGMERLDLSVSGRHEEYSDFGSSTNPKVGVLYAPTADVSIRGSWGKSFRAPNLQYEYGTRDVNPGDATFYGGSNYPPDAQVLAVGGSNPSLRPETARSWTAGLDYKPAWATGLRSSLTYFDISYRGRIADPISDPSVSLSNPIYAPFITYNPGLAAQQASIAASNFYADYTSAGYDPTKVVAIVYDQFQNLVSQHIHGVDFITDYRFGGPFGTLDLTFNATWLTLKQQLTTQSVEETVSGTVFNPSKFRSRIGAVWQKGPWSLDSFLNYVSGETDDTETVPTHVSSWTTLDARISYDPSHWGALFRGLNLAVAGQNLLNRNPPALQATSTVIPGLGFDSTNASALGRFVNATIRKEW